MVEIVVKDISCRSADPLDRGYTVGGLTCWSETGKDITEWASLCWTKSQTATSDAIPKKTLGLDWSGFHCKAIWAYEALLKTVEESARICGVLFVCLFY